MMTLVGAFVVSDAIFIKSICIRIMLVSTICFIFLVMKPYIFIAEKFAYQLWHF